MPATDLKAKEYTSLSRQFPPDCAGSKDLLKIFSEQVVKKGG
jgi:hypothetical protein